MATPYSWENNFHLAWKEKEGSSIEYESNGISIKLKNAEKPEYYTCRNWQFANRISKELG